MKNGFPSVSSASSVVESLILQRVLTKQVAENPAAASFSSLSPA